MPIYNKPSSLLVYDLINESNPDLEIPVAPGNIALGVPQAVTPTGGAIQNTKIRLTPKGSGELIGSVEVTYRRIAAATLFRGLSVEIHKWSPNMGATNSTVFTIHQLLPDINEKYGVNLTEEDVTNANIQRGSVQENGRWTRSQTVTITSTSLGYVGSFQLKWVEAPRDLSGLIQVRDIPGRKFPGGNDFSNMETHGRVADIYRFGDDWTEAVSSTYSASGVYGRSAVVVNTTMRGVLDALLTKINADFGLNFTINDLANGWFQQGVEIPAGAIPELNQKYNRAVILDYNGDGPRNGFVGRFILHWNKF